MTSYLKIDKINGTRIIKIYISEMIKLSIKYEYNNSLIKIILISIQTWNFFGII